MFPAGRVSALTANSQLEIRVGILESYICVVCANAKLKSTKHHAWVMAKGSPKIFHINAQLP